MKTKRGEVQFAQAQEGVRGAVVTDHLAPEKQNAMTVM